MTLYMFFINILGCFIMAIDKQKARKRKWRIAESTIWCVSLIGGAIGTTIGMHLFHHKTKHRLFRYGLPLLAFLDVIVYFIFYQ
ncbi:DUF1294 domain-containing protein [Thermaerobacillus caldiproteolyticus]|uniref:Uncharacterized membrane protein YsdA (DUF1294 family) n=3 Tax=Thermaerobacillus caldiproteolyticus TaxID=247480 RepID=A0A7V9Z4A4_9BACL|nr:DUF1294 domain-containing protein [Anoxybacillus caldiproteolyticus]MBA2873764.1 uncharacterized membrane protein YsdA (DUF1294 family) [Anoxybacillus caldiproteolyticus]QPA30324.1 DUF1294 domain-containing protein [Anoxybacillus caldiproteolyticus]